MTAGPVRCEVGWDGSGLRWNARISLYWVAWAGLGDTDRWLGAVSGGRLHGGLGLGGWVAVLSGGADSGGRLHGGLIWDGMGRGGEGGISCC